MPKKIASHCVLGLVRPRQLNDFSQVMQHNPSIEQTLIELRIDFANSICQAHHGRRMIGQACFKGMVISLGSWIGVKFLIILGVELSDNSLPNRIFYFENHLRHVVTDFLDINWRLDLEISWIIGFARLRQAKGNLIDLRGVVINFSASFHVNNLTCCKGLNIMRLGIPEFPFNLATIILEGKG